MEFSALTNTGHTLCGNNNNVINSDGISIEYLLEMANYCDYAVFSFIVNEFVSAVLR